MKSRRIHLRKTLKLLAFFSADTYTEKGGPFDAES